MELFALGWPQIAILPISAFQVTTIIDVSYQWYVAMIMRFFFKTVLRITQQNFLTILNFFFFVGGIKTGSIYSSGWL
jgi:hypothetical protein